MKKKYIILVLVLLILISGIGFVSAETLTGDLGESGINSTIYNTVDWTTADYPTTTFLYLYGQNVENIPAPFSIVRWMDGTHLSTYDAGAPPTASTNVTIKLTSVGGSVVGNGTIGYQRVYNTALPPVEQPTGFQYLIFDNWNIGASTGTQRFYLEYNHSKLYNQTGAWLANPSQPPQSVSSMVFLNFGGVQTATYYYMNGVLLLNREVSTFASYTATKPQGLGISGTINKSVDGTNYASRAFIFNSTGRTITSDPASNTNPFNFSVPNDQIKIGILSPSNIWYNTSLLFSSGTGTPTPTPTPTPTVTLLPGQFWTTFAAQDATTGGLIPGAEIDIYSRFAGTWNNATTSTGERTIATSSDNYYDVNGNASGYSRGSLTNVMAYNNAYYLVNLFPTTGLPSVPGQVNLFVSVTERETGLPIVGASVSVATPGSWTVQGETDNKGIETFSTSNSSVKYITVSKTGYKAETRTITTPASGNYNAVLQMSRIVVTTVPTGYIPPGSVTPVTTMDSRSTTEKDVDMMNMIRDSGPQLIQLAIVVTMISLLGLMTKGFGK